MIVIVCVDDKNGMMFNHRRQSRDIVVCRDILSECAGKILYMSTYSGKLFEEMNGRNIEVESRTQTKVTDDFLKQAGRGDACFVEDMDITGLEDLILEVILYKWNRRYPANQYFPIDLSGGLWKLTRTEEFAGSSHEKITKEIYERVR